MQSSPPKTDWKRHLGEWLLLGAVLLALGGSATWWHRAEAERLLNTEQERLDVFANFVVNDIAVNLVAVNQALAGVIRDRLPDPERIEVDAVNRRLAALAEAMPSVRGLTVIDAAGTVTAAVPSDLIGRNFAQRDYFQIPRRQADPATFYLSPPFRSVRDDIVVSASRMIPGRDGSFRGVVTAVLAPHYFSGLLRAVLYANDVQASIARAGGPAFLSLGGEHADAPAHGAAARTGLLTAPAAPLLVRRAIRPDNVGIDTPLTLTITRDPAAVLAPLQGQASLFAVLFALFALLAAGVLAYLQRRRERQGVLEAEQQRERAQSGALRDSETRFRTLIEEAPVAVAMLRDGQFIYTNRRYKLLHGYPASESMAGLPWRSMIAPESLARLREQETLIGADSPAEQQFEAIGLGSGQARIPVLKSTARVEMGDGPATLIFTQDISAQKRAEAFLLEARDAAEAASRGKAEFLANMSHEIRTPLNAILGLAYLLEQSRLAPDAHAMLLKIRASGRTLLGIINDVLDVSKIEAGAMTIDRSWFALQDVIDNVAASMGVAVGDKDLAVLVQPLPPQVANVMGDALRLEQLLVNLTSNAIKFTGSGQVELAVLAGGHDRERADERAGERMEERMQLRFEVRDTGIGIEAAQQQAIFAPFTQADSSTTRRFGGSGLGLTICKQLVSLMGGQIGVRSTVGVGSTFWFTIPVECLPAAAASASYSSPDMLRLDLLVAADHAPALDNATQVARSLLWQASGAAITPSSAAAEPILAVLRRRRSENALPGAILLDCQGDGAASLELARAIRQIIGEDGCPVLAMTSTYSVSSLHDGDSGLPLAQGAIDAVLTKPLTASTLYNAVIEARRKRASQQPGAASAAGQGQLAGLRLLVVDDSEINREVARRILADQGAEVALADDGSAALAWLEQHGDAVDLVLMDVQMPVMDGIEATRRLRALPRFAHLPIVALTAGAFQSHHDAARAAGMSHFITKPFDIPLTIALIRRLTGRPDAGEAPAAALSATPPP